MKLIELKTLVKKHGIKIWRNSLNKPELIDLLFEKGVLSHDEAEKEKQRREPKVPSTDPKYERLKYIRNQPRRVDILDLETGEVSSYSSLYKAGKAHGQEARTILFFNGRVWRNRYEIKVHEKEGDDDLVEI